VPPDDGLVIVAATALEANAVRRAAPEVRVVQSGVALTRANAVDLGERVVSCGLAGGLRADLASGTVLIPREVRRPNGETLQCDAELVDALYGSARRLGIEPVTDPLLTSERIVNGAERTQWAARGYAGVDMETGRIVASRVAAVRVILDTPLRELSSDWLNPGRALRNPRNWPQALWLARAAPNAARLAARIVAEANFGAPR
jgi:4-hydroxy-3-methylbut-2-en-1-yl diphosphate reductase